MTSTAGSQETIDDFLLDGGENAIPATPWDFVDMLDLEALPERPSDLLAIAEDNEDELAIPEVTAEDYDGPERGIYLKLRERIRLACNVNTPSPARMAAAEWIFASNSEDKEGTTFRLACRALGARHIVLQARLQYQLYWAGIPYPEPLPIICDGLPETIASEIAYHAGMDGLDIAKTAWRWPGIRADILRERLSDIPDKQFQRATEKLEETGHLGLKHGCWFMVSRNPEMFAIEGRRRFLWSYSFIGDE